MTSWVSKEGVNASGVSLCTLEVQRHLSKPCRIPAGHSPQCAEMGSSWRREEQGDEGLALAGLAQEK